MNNSNLFLAIAKQDNNQVIDYFKTHNLEQTDEYGRTALINAAFYNNIGLIEWLLNQGANIHASDKQGYTALHFAAQEAHQQALSLLLTHHANINQQDVHGNTPAWVCVMHWRGGKNFDNLKTLYRAGADLTIKNQAGRSALEIIPEKIMQQLLS